MIILSLPHKSGETFNILRAETEDSIMEVIAKESVLLNAEGEMKWKEESSLKDFIHPSVLIKSELPFLAIAPTLEEFEKHYLAKAKEEFESLQNIPETLNENEGV